MDTFFSKVKTDACLTETCWRCGCHYSWNFPSSMITRKLAPALAAGCTAVLKPSPETPLSAIEIFKIFEAAGFPKGVVNLVTGDADAIGKQLLTHQKVRMITFTGSTNVRSEERRVGKECRSWWSRGRYTTHVSMR